MIINHTTIWCWNDRSQGCFDNMTVVGAKIRVYEKSVFDFN